MGLTSILAGLFAGAEERGKVYGFLSLTSGLGSLIGGLIIGPLVDRWGYPTMFALLSLFLALWPAAAFVLRDERADRASVDERSVTDGRLRLGKGFYLLFAASLLASSASFVGILSSSLRMNALGFAATAISSTVAVSSALTLPLPLLIGRLSDQFGRKRFLLLCYLVTAASLVLLSLSSAVWHFWVAVSLRALSFAIVNAVGPALANDLVPRESLGRGLGLYGATSWIGAIIGFAGTGHAVQRLGLTPTLIAGAALPLISIFLLAPVRQVKAPSE